MAIASCTSMLLPILFPKCFLTFQNGSRNQKRSAFRNVILHSKRKKDVQEATWEVQEAIARKNKH